MSKKSHEWLIEAVASSSDDQSSARWLAVKLAEKDQEIEHLKKVVKALEQTHEEESKAEFQEVEIGRRFMRIAEKYMKATCDKSKKEGTAYPFWMVERTEGTGYACPFFSREDAEAYRLTLNHPYWYTVRCHSCTYSAAFIAILDLAASIIGGNPN